MTPRNLAIVIHSLDGGGAERTAAHMAGHWAEEGHAVTLITLDSADNDRYPLPPEVNRTALDLMGHSANPLSAIRNNLRRVKCLRRAIAAAEPQQIISLTDKTNILALAACRNLKLPVIVAERIDPRFHSIGRFWSHLRERFYPRAAAIVVQTDDVRDALGPRFPDRPVYVIANLTENPYGAGCSQVSDEGGREHLPEAVSISDRRRVFGMGRLTKQKGFDLLVRAFALAAEKRPNWDVVIFGEGPERNHLEHLAMELGLSDRVFLPGWVERPGEVWRYADLFVLSSRYEGFPNVLLEAMAAGVPSISYDCPSGPDEIIRDGYDGLLVRCGSVEWLAAAMDRLMRDARARRLLSENGPEVLHRFGPEKYYARWEAVLDGRPVDDPIFAEPS